MKQDHHCFKMVDKRNFLKVLSKKKRINSLYKQKGLVVLSGSFFKSEKGPWDSESFCSWKTTQIVYRKVGDDAPV